jgi:hypothetical protein
LSFRLISVVDVLQAVKVFARGAAFGTSATLRHTEFHGAWFNPPKTVRPTPISTILRRHRAKMCNRSWKRRFSWNSWH